MPSPVSELDDHLGYAIRQVSNHVSHAFARKLAARDVALAEWVMLRLLYGNAPLAPSQLADRMAMTRGAISKLADRMIAKGLIRREASSKDGRGQFLSLTESGRALVPELAALADRNDAECFAHLTANERALFQAVLTRTIAHLGIAASPVD